MKYLIISFFGLFASMSFAQSTELNQVSKLIGSFEAENAIEKLEEAESLMTDLFSKKDFRPDAKAYFAKAKVMGLILRNKELEEPIAYAEELITNYSSALSADKQMKLRFKILNEMYLAKIKMTEIGNKSYEKEDFNTAHACYQKALEFNALEVDHPRYMPVDTSLLFTGAVFANLAKKNTEAINGFERLVNMEYPRKDLYDYLISLYTEEGMDAKLKSITALKAQRFPE